jgi:ornithine decarboxylase
MFYKPMNPARAFLKRPFFTYDMSAPSRLAALWRTIFPRIQPYYAVKSNPDEKLIDALAAENVNFDCASLGEIELVMNRGVPADRIIFAHTMKFPEHLAKAAHLGVNITTFDGHHELDKIARFHPAGRALLRIRSDDPDARCLLGNKFGAEPHEIRGLLEKARDLGVDFRGVAFHVGSGSKNAEAYYRAIRLAGETFGVARTLGFAPDTLDIGGGFCVNANATGLEGDVDVRINAALEEFFPREQVKVVAEPGRFFSESFGSYAVRVVGKRERSGAIEYFLNDGVYGSFGNVVYEKYVPKNVMVHRADDSDGLFDSVLYGPTCDSVDKLGNVMLPKLDVDDWLVFERFGAYTAATSTKFNGYGHHDVYYSFRADERTRDTARSPPSARRTLAGVPHRHLP